MFFQRYIDNAVLVLGLTFKIADNLFDCVFVARGLCIFGRYFYLFFLKFFFSNIYRYIDDIRQIRYWYRLLSCLPTSVTESLSSAFAFMSH